jgi:hypothetical protein
MVQSNERYRDLDLVPFYHDVSMKGCDASTLSQVTRGSMWEKLIYLADGA